MSEVRFLVARIGRSRERRSSRRFEIVGELWTALEWQESWALRNIGRGGALVESRHPLPIESLHAVSLSPSPGNAIRARVRHLSRVGGDNALRPYLIGFEFLDRHGDEATEQIDALIETVAADPTES